METGSTGVGRIFAALRATTSPALASNGLTRVRIVSATNARVDNLEGRSNAGAGTDVSLANVPMTSLVVWRKAPGAFSVQLEVTDACGVWPTFIGGGSGLP